MAWEAAVGRADITPPAGIPMGGYGTPFGCTPRTAVGPSSPLWARAVALWDSGRPHVLLCADIIGWSTAAATQIRQRVASATGLGEALLLLTSTHTHNGAALPGVADPWLTYELTDTAPLADYETVLVDTVVELVIGLLEGERRPVTVDYQVTSASFSANREDLPYTESDVPVLVARAPDRSPVAVVFSYGCHPVCAGVQDQWDGDYPAAAAALIDDAFPDGIGLFLPGPAGDQDPVGERGWQLVHDCGAQLADAVMAAVGLPGRPLAGVSAAWLGTASVPLDVTLDPVNLAQARQDYAERASHPGPGWVMRHAAKMVELIDSGEALETAVDLPIQVWQLGGTSPLRMAFVGGEIVSGYAVSLRDRCGGTERLWVGGYGPGAVAYLPSDELLPPIRSGGSYAGGWDPDRPGLAGASMCAYGHPGHFLAGAVEPAIVEALIPTLA